MRERPKRGYPPLSAKNNYNKFCATEEFTPFLPIYSLGTNFKSIINVCLETSIPCSLTVCSPGYLFVGSRLGDSVLLRYKKTAMEIISNCNAETLLVSSPNNDASMKGELDEEDLFLYSNIETEKVTNLACIR